MARRSRSKSRSGSKPRVTKLEVPVPDNLIAPDWGDDHPGTPRDPLLSVRDTGYGTYNTLAIDIIGDVSELIPDVRTRTPVNVQVAPPGKDRLLAVIPCKKDTAHSFAMTWSPDLKKATMRMRRILTKAGVKLPGPGFVLELPVQAFQHPDHGWSVGVAISGTTRPEGRRGSSKTEPAPGSTPNPTGETPPAAGPGPQSQT